MAGKKTSVSGKQNPRATAQPLTSGAGFASTPKSADTASRAASPLTSGAGFASVTPKKTAR